MAVWRILVNSSKSEIGKSEYLKSDLSDLDRENISIRSRSANSQNNLRIFQSVRFRFVTVPPGSSPSSVRAVDTGEARLVGVLGVEVDDELVVVIELRCRDPGTVRFVKTLPVNEVSELATMKPRIQNGFDLPMFFTVDDLGIRVLRSWSGRKGVREVAFEQGDVENRMNLDRVWKQESEGGLAYRFVDPEGAELFCVEFVGRSEGLDVATQKPNRIARFKVRSRETPLVGPESVLVKGFLDVGPGSLVNRFQALEVFLRRGYRCLGESDGKARIVPLVGEERRHTQRRVVRGVVRKLCQRQQVNPIVLEVVAENAQMLFHRLVNSFSLAVRLRVESGGQVGTDVQHLEEFLPPLRSEGGTTIRDNVRGQAMLAEDMSEKLGGEGLGVVGLICRDELRLFGETINHNKDAVGSTGRR